jgi:hypothetical protein
MPFCGRIKHQKHQSNGLKGCEDMPKQSGKAVPNTCRGADVNFLPALHPKIELLILIKQTSN